jgi:broad specificity polyphosphatase/5'/3'-nucleotidase SurE
MHRNILFLVLFAFSFLASAENATNAGKYKIHHNAITTDFLSASVAKAYKIPRSTERALLNIAITETRDDQIDKPVSARLDVIRRNLLGYREELEMQEVREGDAIYYITDFAISHKDQWIFDIEALVEGQVYPLKVQYRETFITE